IGRRSICCDSCGSSASLDSNPPDSNPPATTAADRAPPVELIKQREMSFCLPFHPALLSLTGAYWLDDPPDLSCKESTRQHAVDGSLLSCKQQVGGSSPPASSQHRRSQGVLVSYGGDSAKNPPLPHRPEFRQQPHRSGQARVRTAASRFRGSGEIVVSRSVPSCSPTGRRIFGSWAVGLRKALKTPRTMKVSPRCSLRSVSVASELKAISGRPPVDPGSSTWSTSRAPSASTPVICGARCAG